MERKIDFIFILVQIRNKLKNESFVFTEDAARWCHHVCTTTLICVEQQSDCSPPIEPQHIANRPAKAAMPLTNIHPIRAELEHWPQCFCLAEFSEFQVTFINTCRWDVALLPAASHTCVVAADINSTKYLPEEMGVLRAHHRGLYLAAL